MTLLARFQNSRNALGLAFMLPAALLLLLFLTYPLGLGTYLGFTDAKVGRAGEWIGLENYEYLWGDAVTRLALFNTLFYTAVASVLKFFLGLWLAILLNRNIRFKTFFRAVILLPYIVPTALSAIAFWWIYDSQFSIISWALVKMGLIDQYIDFLGSPWNARIAVIIANVWRGVPFVAITLLAGLQTISPSYYEASAIDGATPWQQFRHVTMPLLTPIIAVVMTFSVLFTFTDFQLIYVITRGGPLNATHLMATLSFQRAISGGALGEGAAIAIAMVPFLLACVMFSFFGLQRRAWQQAAPTNEGTPMSNAGQVDTVGMSYLDSIPRKLVTVYLPLLVFLIVLLFPFYWMAITSVKPDAELLSREGNPFWVIHPTLAHFYKLLFETSYPQWLWNTVLVSVVSTFVSLAASVFAAYAIERLRFKGSKHVGLSIFLAYMVPPSILFIPLANVVFNLGLFDTRWALILTYPTFLIPFCTWLLMGYFRSIPAELEECALIDGASRWQILVKIVLPLAVPGLISAGIFAFTLSWNEFIYALTFISSSEVKTLPVGVVTELVQGDVYQWGPLMAGALLGSLPVAFIYSFFVEYYVSGMTGSVKE